MPSQLDTSGITLLGAPVTGRPAPQIRAFDRYYCDEPNRNLVMVSLQMDALPDAGVTGFNLYRSFVGFEAPLNSFAVGQTLSLKIDGGQIQNIMIETDIVASIAAVISGAVVYQSANDPSYFILRTLSGNTGTVELLTCSALTPLSLTAGVISSGSLVGYLASVSATGQAPFIFDDKDGAVDDLYGVATVDANGNESNISSFDYPAAAAGPLCRVEGVVIDVQGSRVIDSPVFVTIMNPPDSFNPAAVLNPREIQVLSGPDGRFSLSLLQGALVRIRIPDAALDRPVTIPAQAFAFINDLPVDLDYRYPTGYVNG